MVVFLAIAAEWFGGYYELEYSAHKKSNFEWNVAVPHHFVSLRYWNSPANGVEGYTQFGARTDPDEFFIERSWIKGFKSYKRMSFDGILFAKEERHWIDSPLLRIVEPSKASDFYNSIGTRLDSRIGIFDFTALYSIRRQWHLAEWYGKYFSQTGDDFIISGKLKTGILSLSLSYIHTRLNFDVYSVSKDTSGIVTGFIFERNLKPYNSAIVSNLRLKILDSQFNIEVARSTSHLYGDTTGDNSNAYSLEWRDVFFGPFIFRAGLFNYGRDFRSEVSNNFSKENHIFDRSGYEAEVNYQHPYKQLKLALKNVSYTSSFKRVENDINLREAYRVFFDTASYSVSDYESRILMGFKGGLRSILGFSYSKIKETSSAGAFFEAFYEGERSILKMQYRIKHIGIKENEADVLGAEARYNITDKTSIFFREVLVYLRHLSKLTRTAFIQLRYYRGWNLDTYIEYGNGFVSGDLAFSGGIFDPALDIEHMFKVFMRIGF